MHGEEGVGGGKKSFARRWRARRSGGGGRLAVSSIVKGQTEDARSTGARRGGAAVADHGWRGRFKERGREKERMCVVYLAVARTTGSAAAAAAARRPAARTTMADIAEGSGGGAAAARAAWGAAEGRGGTGGA